MPGKKATIAREPSKARGWLNVKEATEFLGVSRQSLYNLMDRGLLPYAEVIGVRGRRIQKEDLVKLLRHGPPAKE